MRQPPFHLSERGGGGEEEGESLFRFESLSSDLSIMALLQHLITTETTAD